MNTAIPTQRPIAVVSGASSGFGAAASIALSKAGYDVVIGARRVERLEEVAAACEGSPRALPLDVTDAESVAAFAAHVPVCTLLVNNAGGAHGTETVVDAVEEDWQWMFDTNVLGTVRMTKALIGALRASGDGQIINIGSIAAREPYNGGAGYNAAKHSIAVISKVLRLELVGEPIRIAEIDPGFARTEFAKVRLNGDAEAEAALYRGMTPLTAEDIAEAIVWVATRPSHVNVDQLLIMPRDQASARIIHRAE